MTSSNPRKRKRQGQDISLPSISTTPSSRSSSTPEREQDAHAIFRRHFEAHFKPLPLPLIEETAPPLGTVTDAIHDAGSAEGSDWEGISEGEGNGEIEVMEHHSIVQAQLGLSMSREERRMFMSSRPPTDTSIPSSSSKSSQNPLVPSKADPSEAAHLKNDLALQRLLAESHLLDPTNGADLDLQGTNRHKALDLRIQKLGGKKSILVQEKMPMAHRKGIMLKKVEREEKRRREARENGVILERVVGRKEGKEGKERKEKRREKGVGGPGVGTFRGGMLRLSKRDVFAIEGGGSMSGGKSGRGGKGGRGGGGGGRGGGKGRAGTRSH